MKNVCKFLTATLGVLCLFTACKRELQEPGSGAVGASSVAQKVQSNSNILEHSESNLLLVPKIYVRISGPNQIKNGTEKTYTATVFYEDNRPEGVQENDRAYQPKLTGTLTVTAPNNTTVLSTTVDVDLDGRTSRSFTLKCDPSGRSGTLRTSAGRDTHAGSRICDSNEIIVFPATPPCPPKRGTRWFPPCPPGCGQPAVTRTVVICTDNAASLTATFRPTRGGAYNTSMNILCIPSEGPTQGTL